MSFGVLRHTKQYVRSYIHIEMESEVWIEFQNALTNSFAVSCGKYRRSGPLFSIKSPCNTLFMMWAHGFD